MDFNDFLFPAPENSFIYKKIDDVIYIPKKTYTKAPNVLDLTKWRTDSAQSQGKKQDEKPDDYIPCIYIPFEEGSDKLLVFFHGNAEDIGWSMDFLKSLQNYLGIHVMSVEYPGYSQYIGKPSADQILEDAETVYEFINLEIGVPQENIFLFGRSIGSGPATYLAAKKDPGCLILMSAFTSIRSVVKGIFGSVLSYMVADRFNNLEEIKKAKCPVLIIHGKKDELIKNDQAIQLLQACKQTTCHIKLSDDMTHDDFAFEDDLIDPIYEFLEKCEIEIENGFQFYDVPTDLYLKPECMKDKENKRTFVAKIYDRFLD